VIGLLMATLLEAHPFVEKLLLKEYEKNPFEVYGNENIVLIISGIGKANAAMSCAYLVLRYAPDCVCNLGAAGANDRSIPLKAMCQISKIIEPDRPVLGSGIFHEHIPNLLEGFPFASLATQDKPAVTSAEREQLALKAQLTDMEGASAVQTCRQFGTDCYVFKFVSDTPDDHCIVKNIRQYRDDFCLLFCKSVLPVLQQRLKQPISHELPCSANPSE
jgi:adenosylhomocysteine nucleosidase